MVGDETCDDGYSDTAGCINCVLQYGYKCDSDGHNCKCVHGDGKVCKEEQCDDGDDNSVACKNGIIQEGYECFNTPNAPSVCIPKGCRNGKLNEGEECDDGNDIDDDGCSNDCKLGDPKDFQCIVSEDRTVPTKCYRRECGDGIRTDDEECDAGTKNGEGKGCNNCKIEQYYTCSTELFKESDCGLQAKCGDGFRLPYLEECDDNNTVDGDGCNSTCYIEPGWVCVNDGVGSKCHIPVCGDGVVEGSEECDDANTDDGDGCSSTCIREPGFRCSIPRKGGHSICRSSCGDGMKSSTEECDDGNLVGGDGCSPTCKIEHGYDCFVNFSDPACARGCMSLCYATCGDGIVAQEEECDDGNSFQGDGCHNCKLESENWRCKGEPSECILRECTLQYPVVTVSDILCHGSSSGVIDVSVNTTDEVVMKVWKDDTMEPNSYQSSSHFTNLAAGMYNVKVSVVGFMECERSVKVEIKQPTAFTGVNAKLNTAFGWPTSCTNADGWIKWTPSGGVKPYKFFFANRSLTGSDSCTFDGVDIKEFISGRPLLVDSNNCTREMEVDAEQWPDSSVCQGETVPYLTEGAVGLAAAFVVAIIAGISYSCWSSKRQVPKNWKPPK